MKTRINEVLDLLEKYNFKNSYAKFECYTESETAILQAKKVFYNHDKKYTTDFNHEEIEIVLEVVGLSDFFNSMPILDLVTDKGVEYLEVSIIKHNRRDEIKEKIDVFGFNTHELVDN